MSNNGEYKLRRLAPEDLGIMDAMMRMFGTVFNEMDTYVGNPPSADYTKRLLGSGNFIALAAVKGKQVVGGLTAYVLEKYEQERSEIYIYDLAVVEDCRRQGVATGLIQGMKKVAADRGAYVIIIQADTGPEDQPAISLYSKLGIRENVLHFDIPVDDDV